MSATTRRKKSAAARAAATTPAPRRQPHRFWLVQRLTTPRAQRGAGFDALFRLDYMGSAEFEWGAVPKALRSVRAARDLTISPRYLTFDGQARMVYLVGPEQGMDDKAADLQAWLDAGCPGKERSRFRSALLGLLDEWDRDLVAWWSLNDDIAWTLDVETAQKLLAGFAGKMHKP